MIGRTTETPGDRAEPLRDVAEAGAVESGASVADAGRLGGRSCALVTCAGALVALTAAPASAAERLGVCSGLCGDISGQPGNISARLGAMDERIGKIGQWLPNLGARRPI